MSSATSPSMGSWVRQEGTRSIAEPRDERELIEMLHVLADRGASLNRELTLSRARLQHLGAVQGKAMTVLAGAGVILRELDEHLRRQGLTVGPLSPRALELRLCEFLEGPYAGLRAIRGGRLEPVCSSLTAISSDGRKLVTSHGPRSAAGPDLAALVLGGAGRMALVTAAVVRCFPLAERNTTLFWRFSSCAAAAEGIRTVISDGFVPTVIELHPDAPSVRASFAWDGTVGSVERDRELLLRLLPAFGAPMPVDQVPAGLPSGDETEANWASIETALEAGRALRLHRVTLSTAVVEGDVKGLPLGTATAWSAERHRLLALDERRTLGGAV